MLNRWSSTEADQFIKFYQTQGVSAELALRVYTSRLLGQEKKLVLHGGGNTSVKMIMHDILQQPLEVLCVKGSGSDLEFIQPDDLPAVKLTPLLQLKSLSSLTDEAMVNYQRVHLLNYSAPNPSIETLLHAFIPHPYVDHTHANAILSLVDQPNGEEIIKSIFKERIAIVPYIKPGFDLAKKALEIYEQNPQVEGLILMKHGIFTFGKTAKESYDRMIELVDLAERMLAEKISCHEVYDLPETIDYAAIAPIIRGFCSEKQPLTKHQFKSMILHLRSNEKILDYVNGKNLQSYSQRGVVTPDHIIRTKNYPLLLSNIRTDDLNNFYQACESAFHQYAINYKNYFEKNNALQSSPKKMLDLLPRVILIPGLGLIALGRSLNDAQIVADLAEATIETILDAEKYGRFSPLSEEELFDIEYWSLEQAKLNKQSEKSFSRKVVVITGGAGTIGRATAKAFKQEGAEVFILDFDEDKLYQTAKELGVLGLHCDVTNMTKVNHTFHKICEMVGGVDVIVSNAGKAITSSLLTLTESQLQQSMQINFYSHYYVAQAALDVMLKQKMGGVLLFNVSKQALNPGENFGAYGIAKSATLALARQYALEFGRYGIRSNIVNADRIRSGLLTDEMIASRAESRKISEAEYMSGNLLSTEVTAEDVAKAFVHQALAEKTTANIMTVDGGNMAAAVR